MTNTIYPFLATLAVSLVSLVGIASVFFKTETLNKFLLYLVGFSAGSMLGSAFFHLIPEGLEKNGSESFFVFVATGMIFFLFLEKFIHWRHCHKVGGQCDAHTFAHINLVGDGLHNFIDGLVIAGSFLVSPVLGVSTFFAVLLHEIPQEISDFGVLVYGGFSKKKALAYNFLTALAAILGCAIGVWLFGRFDGFIGPLLGVTAGGFIYIAASDLVPEIHKKSAMNSSFWPFLAFLLGMTFIYLI